MKRWKVVVEGDVRGDIDEVVLFIARDSVDNALAWQDRVRDVLADLANFAGHAIDEPASDRLGFEVRKVVFERTYLIHYVLEEEEGLATVIGFRHGAREPRRGEP